MLYCRRTSDRRGCAIGRFGAHVKTAGGLRTAVDHALAIGAEALQIFVGAPQRWAAAKYTDEDCAAFQQWCEESALGPVFIHAPYLINLASPRDDLRAISADALVSQLRWADRMGARGVVVHVGSGGPDGAAGDEAIERAVASLRRVIDTHAGPSTIILENDAGAGRRIGRSFVEIGQLLRALGPDQRLEACIDTAHSLACGYELRTPAGLAAAVEEFDREVGFDRLALVHANDSKVDLGSNRDRHENIGQGFIGEDAFGRILRHPRFAKVPFVLEVPGFDGKGPDAENLNILRRLAGVEQVHPTTKIAVVSANG